MTKIYVFIITVLTNITCNYSLNSITIGIAKTLFKNDFLLLSLQGSQNDKIYSSEVNDLKSLNDSLKTSNAKTSSFLNKIYNDFPINTEKKIREYHFFSLENLLKFSKFGNKNNFTSTNNHCKPFKMMLSISRNEITYQTQAPINFIDFEIFNLSAIRVIEKTTLTNGETKNFDKLLTPGNYFAVFYVGHKFKALKLIKIANELNYQLIKGSYDSMN